MKQKMYSIVLRHLSGIQKGIQHGHSKDSYEQSFSRDKEYQQWLKKDKTVIVLECDSCQQILDAEKMLRDENVKCSVFREPDLGNIPTSISFLVDERYWPSKNLENIATEMANGENVDYEKEVFFEHFLLSYRLASN